MHLTPKEEDKLKLLTLGMIAERRLQKGLKLNYPESVAYITSCALEGAREGKTVEEVMHDAANVLTKDQGDGRCRRYDRAPAGRSRIHRWVQARVNPQAYQVTGITT